MMFLGPNIQGDRVVGTTDAGLKPIALDAATLEPDPEGVQITPQHVHQALRRVAGLDTGELAKLYPIATDNLALFG